MGSFWHDALEAAGNSDANLDHEILQWFLHWNLCHRVFNEILHSSVSWRKKKRENVKRRRIPDRCCEQAPSEIQKDRWQHDLATSTANKNSQVSQFSLAASYCYRLRFLTTDCIRHCQWTKAFSANFICQIHSKQRVCNNWGPTMSPSYCFSIQSSATFQYNGVSLFHTVFHCCCISKLCIILGEVQYAEECSAGFVGILCTKCSSSWVQQLGVAAGCHTSIMGRQRFA